jgi:hypothetical protein
MKSFEIQRYRDGAWKTDSIYDDRELAEMEAPHGSIGPFRQPANPGRNLKRAIEKHLDADHLPRQAVPRKNRRKNPIFDAGKARHDE